MHTYVDAIDYDGYSTETSDTEDAVELPDHLTTRRDLIRRERARRLARRVLIAGLVGVAVLTALALRPR